MKVRALRLAGEPLAPRSFRSGSSETVLCTRRIRASCCSLWGQPEPVRRYATPTGLAAGSSWPKLQLDARRHELPSLSVGSASPRLVPWLVALRAPEHELQHARFVRRREDVHVIARLEDGGAAWRDELVAAHDEQSRRAGGERNLLYLDATHRDRRVDVERQDLAAQQLRRADLERRRGRRRIARLEPELLRHPLHRATGDERIDDD